MTHTAPPPGPWTVRLLLVGVAVVWGAAGAVTAAARDSGLAVGAGAAASAILWGAMLALAPPRR